MSTSRRTFLGATAGLAGWALSGGPVRGATASGTPDGRPGPGTIRALALDAFVVFDPRPIDALAEQLVPDRGKDLIDRWRTRQFEYTWLRTVAGQHLDFAAVTEGALRWASRSLQLSLDPGTQRRLLEAHARLGPWPDASAALASLRARGLRLALLSNFTPAMLAGCVRASGLDGVFDRVLSTEAVRTFKPDPRAYQLGVDALRLRREEIAFAAHAGWDAAGARWFGYRTLWVNRLGLPPEELSAQPDAIHSSLGELARALVG